MTVSPFEGIKMLRHFCIGFLAFISVFSGVSDSVELKYCDIDVDCDHFQSIYYTDGQDPTNEGHFFRVKRAFVPYKTGKEVASQVSNALDHLLLYSGYDKRIRPQVLKISCAVKNAKNHHFFIFSWVARLSLWL